MKDKNLKPCPFCGSEEIQGPFLGNSIYWIECDCGVLIELETREAVTEKWNTRQADKLPIKSHHCHTTHTACECVLDRLNTLEGTCENLADDNVEKERRIKQLKKINETLASNNMILVTGFYELQAENKELREQLRWIPVAEGLPEYEVEVLALCDENEDSMVRQLDYNGRWRNCHGADYEYTVTHYMQIPTLPETEK